VGKSERQRKAFVGERPGVSGGFSWRPCPSEGPGGGGGRKSRGENAAGCPCSPPVLTTVTVTGCCGIFSVPNITRFCNLPASPESVGTPSACSGPRRLCKDTGRDHVAPWAMPEADSHCLQAMRRDVGDHTDQAQAAASVPSGQVACSRKGRFESDSGCVASLRGSSEARPSIPLGPARNLAAGASPAGHSKGLFQWVVGFGTTHNRNLDGHNTMSAKLC